MGQMYLLVCTCDDSNQGICDEIRRGKCKLCGATYRNVTVEKSGKPEAVIDAAEADLESANYRSIGRLPTKLWQAISPLVPPVLLMRLAETIRETMPG
jgi:hypothetical protein